MNCCLVRYKNKDLSFSTRIVKDNEYYFQFGKRMLLKKPTPLSQELGGARFLTANQVWRNSYFTHKTTPRIGAVAPAERGSNWGVANYLGLDRLWAKGITGAGVKIGVADSGIDTSHPCFSQSRVEKFVEIDLESGEIIPGEVSDSGWHGTACASVLVGKENDDILLGGAPEASLYVAKCLNGMNGSVASVQSALDWFLSEKCKIVSLSFGWPGLHDEWADAIKRLTDSGALVFCGIGNEYGLRGRETISPANYPYPGLVGVGAHSGEGDVWRLSGGGEVEWSVGSVFGEQKVIKPDIVFPGELVTMASPNDSYVLESGTSFATPLIASLAALLWQKFPNATNIEILEIIYSSVEDVGETGKDARFGYGRILIDQIIEEYLS